MSERHEEVRPTGQAFMAKVQELIHEGNVRRVIIKNGSGRTVMEIPVTAGVVAVALAPMLAALGALAALASDWHIEVERREPPASEVVVDAEEK